ncbi:MAG: hypothetical protein IPK06_02255 [Ignavibacteriae bacterium]|nr:hypothetical protein [Ignavibacteriota bacterium]
MNKIKKTILYIGGFELPDRNAAAQRVVAVGKLFRELGYNVVFIGIDKYLSDNSKIETTKTKYFGFDSWAVSYPKSSINWLKYIGSIYDLEFLIKRYYKNDLFALVFYNHPFLIQYRLRKSKKRWGFLLFLMLLNGIVDVAEE